MRPGLTLLAVAALCSSGCSLLVADSGRQLSKITTRDEAHEVFGSPMVSGQVNGREFEDFITWGKIAEPEKGIYATMGFMAPLGFGELIWFPHELFLATRRSIVGQRVRFTYDELGRVVEASHDGISAWTPPILPPDRCPVDNPQAP